MMNAGKLNLTTASEEDIAWEKEQMIKKNRRLETFVIVSLILFLLGCSVYLYAHITNTPLSVCIYHSDNDFDYSTVNIADAAIVVSGLIAIIVLFIYWIRMLKYKVRPVWKPIMIGICWFLILVLIGCIQVLPITRLVATGSTNTRTRIVNDTINAYSNPFTNSD